MPYNLSTWLRQENHSFEANLGCIVWFWLKKKKVQEWWYTSLIPVPGKQRQKDHWIGGQSVMCSKFQASPELHSEPCFKTKQIIILKHQKKLWKKPVGEEKRKRKQLRRQTESLELASWHVYSELHSFWGPASPYVAIAVQHSTSFLHPI